MNERRPDTTSLLPFVQYDLAIVCFSGGKDSLASALTLIDSGFPKERIQLWHQKVDGGGRHLFDWPCTEAYCEAVAAHLGLPLLYQWRVGGLEREMFREGTPTAPVRFQCQDGKVREAGGKGPPGTRLKYPQKSGDLSVRWCSAYGKIDTAAIAISNDPGLKDKTILVLSGERRQESANRSRYATFEKHRRSSGKRRVDQWRNVLEWSEEKVWDRIRLACIRAHVAYHLGYGRLSCQHCIFADSWQTAMNRLISPAVFAEHAANEVRFGLTITRGKSLPLVADSLKESLMPPDPVLVAAAMSSARPYAFPIHTPDWLLPAGAFKRSGGPT